MHIFGLLKQPLHLVALDDFNFTEELSTGSNNLLV
jgi:hypothetical protein